MVQKKSNGALKRNRNVKKKLPEAISALKKKTLPMCPSAQGTDAACGDCEE